MLGLSKCGREDIYISLELGAGLGWGYLGYSYLLSPARRDSIRPKSRVFVSELRVVGCGVTRCLFLGIKRS